MILDNLSKFKSDFKLYTELRASVNRQQGVSLIKGNLMTNTSATVGGICAHVCDGGVYGFASAPGFSDDDVRRVLAAASDNAALLQSKTGRNDAPPAPVGDGFVGPKTHDHTVPQKYMIDFAGELDAYIVKKYPKLASRFVSAGSLLMEKLLVASDSCGSHLVSPRAHCYVGMTMIGKDGQPAELFEPIGAFGWFDEVYTDPSAFYDKIDRLYEQICEKADGVYARAGVADVVMSPDIGGILAHEAVGHTVEADIVLGGSVAGSNVGKRVASELVTMVDFANTYEGAQLPIPVWVDDEGTPARDAMLIENGILKGFMHNKETARKFSAEPTGNARAWQFSDEPLVRMRNTAILPGKDKVEDMIAAIDDGYYLVKTGNGQADTTSEFTFSVNFGYEIKHGKLGRAIKETTISGIAFDMLKTVDMVGSDMQWCCTGMCGKKQPIPVSMGGPSLKCKVSMGGK